MLKNVLGIGRGLTRRDADYFTNTSRKGRHSRFREDLRAIVGGALAAAFLAAAFSNLIPNTFLSDEAVTASAALAGGVMGKFFLV